VVQHLAKPAIGIVATVAFAAVMVGCATTPRPPPPEPEVSGGDEGVDAVTEGLSPLPMPTRAATPPAPTSGPAPSDDRLRPAPRGGVAARPVGNPPPSTEQVQAVVALLEKAVTTCGGVLNAAGAVIAASNNRRVSGSRGKGRAARAAAAVRQMIEQTTNDVRTLQTVLGANAWLENAAVLADVAHRARELDEACVSLLLALSIR
jgi:hypothetical protein